MVLFFLFPFLALAEPDQLIVVFLSSVESVSFSELVDPQFEYSRELTQSGLKSSCISFGDKCFHPQRGLVDPSQSDTSVEFHQGPSKIIKYDFSDIGKTEDHMGTMGLYSESSLGIDCKEGKFFDIYCGKAKKINSESKEKQAGFEVWIDTSTSMRDSDYQFKKTTCYRKDFADRMRSSCGGVDIYQYSSSKKQVGSTNSLCDNKNQNSQTNLYKWIKNSSAQTLLIVTDASSLDMDFQRVIDSVKGRVYGIEDRMIGGKHLKDYVPKFKKYCKR